MIKIILLGLVLFGMWSSGTLSWRQFHSGEACPILGLVPVCYLVFTGYLTMLCAIILRTWRPLFYWLFWAGLFMVGVLALLGSTFEFIKGPICPRTFGWIPMCYLSLVFSLLIAFLNVLVTRSKKVILSIQSNPDSPS